MFTGIIEGFGYLRAMRPTGQGTRFAIESEFELDRVKLGDSIAVNGACLTAVSLDGRRFEVDVAPESIARTTFAKARIGERMNLERALRLSDRLDGHLVSGHIDGTAVISGKQVHSNAIIVTFSVDSSLSNYMIKKGSVAIDGISLTINNCSRDAFDVSIIPHTAKLTTIGFKEPGETVNIETDMIGKYVEKFLTSGRIPGGGEETEKPGLDMKFLAEKGFL